MIDVIGVGADGQLDQEARTLLATADKVVSSPRLLALLPPGTNCEYHEWPSPLLSGLSELFADRNQRRILVLATGDPLQAGIATTLIRHFGPDGIRVRPALSSITLARAQLGWSAEQTEVVSLLTSPTAALRRYLTPNRRMLLLSPDAATPANVAAELVAAGWPRAQLKELADLGTDKETITAGVAETWAGEPGSPLNIVAVELPSLTPALGTSPGLPDTAFDNDGQITKWEVRVLALASLRPMPGQTLWDLGAGSGSVGIEWALHDPSCRTISVERNPVRAERIAANALSLGATNLRVVSGYSADKLAELPDPDAIFIGGGASAELIDQAYARLRRGGRLVVHTVTLETESLLVGLQARYGGLMRRISVERTEPLGRYLTWVPARAVTHWATTKTEESK